MVLKRYLKEKIEEEVQKWEGEDIDAISFLLNSSAYSFPLLEISFNTKKGCASASKYSEERWNIACWDTDGKFLIDSAEKDAGYMLAMDWFKEQGIDHVGDEEDENTCYDSNMEYIGKGPVGFYELLGLVSSIARHLQTNGFIKNRFGDIPIIVHDLEYAWYSKEATLYANPNGEADDFIEALERGFE